MNEELLDRLSKLLAEEILRAADVRIKADDFGTRPIARAVLQLLREADELPDCQICGGEASVSPYHGIAVNGWVVECSLDMETGDGSHSTGRYPTRRDAIAAWIAANDPAALVKGE